MPDPLITHYSLLITYYSFFPVASFMSEDVNPMSNALKFIPIQKRSLNPKISTISRISLQIFSRNPLLADKLREQVAVCV
jgi:hypothetical protein